MERMQSMQRIAKYAKNSTQKSMKTDVYCYKAKIEEIFT